jgi:hypothetical protein
MGKAIQTKNIHFGHVKKKSHGIEVGWEVLAIMMGISLAIAIRLLWSVGIWLGVK